MNSTLTWKLAKFVTIMFSWPMNLCSITVTLRFSPLLKQQMMFLSVNSSILNYLNIVGVVKTIMVKVFPIVYR
jgi:hypothetical protein